MLLFVHVYGDAATVVDYGYRIVLIDGDAYVGCISGEGFVDGVVYDLIDKVVQTLDADVADIHGWTFPYGFKAFEHLDVTGTVFFCVLVFYIF